MAILRDCLLSAVKLRAVRSMQEAPLYTIHTGQDGVNSLQWWRNTSTTFGLATQGGNIEVGVNHYSGLV